MKRLVAALVFMMTVCTAGLAAAAQYFPVARVDTKAGYSLRAVQSAKPDRKACVAANKRFTDALKGNCPECQIRASECRTRLQGENAAALADKPIRNYAVRAPGIRVIVAGRQAATACEQIAQQSTKRSGQANCVKPGSAD
jgi:hypothetical protein